MTIKIYRVFGKKEMNGHQIKDIKMIVEIIQRIILYNKASFKRAFFFFYNKFYPQQISTKMICFSIY